MQEHLKTNILTFQWPKTAPKFYLSLEEINGSHPVHYSKFSQQVKDKFPETDLSNHKEIYTTFTEKATDSPVIKINFKDRKELKIYGQYLKNEIRKYFREKGFVVTSNFIRNLQVWIPSKKGNTEDYNIYFKFSFKIQFAKLTDKPELVVSYDGTSKVLKTSVKDIEDTIQLRKFIYGQRIFKYQKLIKDNNEEFYNSIDFSKAYPLYNLELAKMIKIPLPEFQRETNKYQTYIRTVETFASRFLFTEEFKNILNFNVNHFIDVPKHLVNQINPEVGVLEFANRKTHKVPKLAMNFNAPYRPPKKPNIKFFFIYHVSHAKIVKEFYNYFKNGVNARSAYYKGFQDYMNLIAKGSGENFIKFKNENDPLPEIIDKLGELSFDTENTKYLAFYISPFDKFSPIPEEREVYIRIKELFLNEKIITQVIDYNKMVENIKNQFNFQFSLQNIALAVHAKLGGVPWKLAVSEEKELVIGVGAFTNKEENRRYIASAFSFQNNGLFRNFEYFNQNDTKQLAGSILTAIRDFTSYSKASKVVIHFYKEMSRKELKPIIEGMYELNLGVSLYILNINKTESEDIISYDLNWGNKLMPKSGTIVRVGKREFLLFNNSRYSTTDKYSDTEGYPFPIKIKISSPDQDAFEDVGIYKELLTQVYQFSRLYWKSLRQQNVPITIKYPEMLAQIAPRFENALPEHAKDKLWFL